jgi:cell division protease FtsH
MQNLNNRNRNNPPRGPGQSGDKKPDGEGGNPRRQRVPTWLIGLLVVSVAVWYAYQTFAPSSDTGRTTIDYTALQGQIAAQNVEEATVSARRVDATLRQPIRYDKENKVVVDGNSANAADFPVVEKIRSTIPPGLRTDMSALITSLTDSGATVTGKDENGSALGTILIQLLPLLLIIGIFVFMGRQMSRGQQNVFGFAGVGPERTTPSGRR